MRESRGREQNRKCHAGELFAPTAPQQGISGEISFAIAFVKKALEKSTSAEQDQRIQAILGKVDRWPTTWLDFQKLRAIEALELIATSASLEVLEEQAVRSPESWRAEEARVAAIRLKQNTKR